MIETGMTTTPATFRAGFAVGDETIAKRVVDTLTEVFFEGDFLDHCFSRLFVFAVL